MYTENTELKNFQPKQHRVVKCFSRDEKVTLVLSCGVRVTLDIVKKGETNFDYYITSVEATPIA